MRLSENSVSGCRLLLICNTVPGVNWLRSAILESGENSGAIEKKQQVTSNFKTLGAKLFQKF